MMSRRRLVFALLASLLVLAGSFGGGTAAAAAQGVPGTPTSKEENVTTWCFAEAVPRGSQEPEKPIECYTERADADRARAEILATTSSALGHFWPHAGAQGQVLIVFGNSCTDTRSLFGQWNNVISSADFFCGGGGTLYDGNFTGANDYYSYGYHSYVGDYMNDRASSIQFYP